MVQDLRSDFWLSLGQRGSAHMACGEFGNIVVGFMVDENTAFGMSKVMGNDRGVDGVLEHDDRL